MAGRRALGISWKLQDAKARLSELVDLAVEGRPQRISRRGKDAVVVIRIEDFEPRPKPRESIVEFFARSPHREVDLTVARSGDTGRDVSG